MSAKQDANGLWHQKYVSDWRLLLTRYIGVGLLLVVLCCCAYFDLTLHLSIS